MGYSIAMRFASTIDRDKMRAFMDANFRPYSDLLGKDGQKDFCASGVNDDLSYDEGEKFGKNLLGFDYGAASRDREYLHIVVAWMALRAGREFKGMPFYIYDGYERIYLEVHESAPNIGAEDLAEKGRASIFRRTTDRPSGASLCDQYGVSWTHRGPRGMNLFIPFSKKDLRAITAEMKRLDELWKP